MKRDWLEMCRLASLTPASYWSSDKKILRNFTFRFPDPFGPLTVEELGYTKTKTRLLVGSYLHKESRDAAIDQWNNRKNYKPKSHWSVGFSCYNHVIKAHSVISTESDSIGSIMGPCLQAVVITHTPETVAEIDVFYRTTELFKKFPADLVLLRDYLLQDFDFDRTPVAGLTVHATNMTVNPTYASVVLTHVKDPVKFLEEVLKVDQPFHRYVGKTLVRMIDGPESTFNQAARTQRAIRELMDDSRQRELVKYFRGYYPEI